MSDKPSETSRKDQAQHLREHYELLIQLGRGWSSTMFKAIDAWEREPDLLAELATAKGERDQAIYTTSVQREQMQRMNEEMQSYADSLRAAKTDLEAARDSDEATQRDMRIAQEILLRIWNPYTTIGSLPQMASVIASELEDKRKMVQANQAQLTKWESGELFSLRAAQIYEGQRKEILRLREVMEAVICAYDRACAPDMHTDMCPAWRQIGDCDCGANKVMDALREALEVKP